MKHTCKSQEKRPHDCSFCDSSFSRKNNLRRHITMVHERKKLEVILQEKSLLKGSNFNKIEYLVDFQALEDKHGPFKRDNGYILCSYCSNRFERPARLKEHIVAVHEGKKPHSCSVCDKSFGMKRNLKKHIESAHESKRFKCTLCEKDFVNRTVLRRHIQIVHDKKEPKLKVD